MMGTVTSRRKSLPDGLLSEKRPQPDTWALTPAKSLLPCTD